MPGINLRARGLLAQGGGFGDLGDEVSAAAGFTVLNVSGTVPRYLNFTAPSGTRWAIVEIGCRYASITANTSAKLGVRRVPSGTSSSAGQPVEEAELTFDNTTPVNTNLFLPLARGDAGLGETPGHNIVEAGESLYVALSSSMDTTINDLVVWVRLFKLPARVGTTNV